MRKNWKRWAMKINYVQRRHRQWQNYPKITIDFWLDERYKRRNSVYDQIESFSFAYLVAVGKNAKASSFASMCTGWRKREATKAEKTSCGNLLTLGGWMLEKNARHRKHTRSKQKGICHMIFPKKKWDETEFFSLSVLYSRDSSLSMATIYRFFLSFLNAVAITRGRWNEYVLRWKHFYEKKNKK